MHHVGERAGADCSRQRQMAIGDCERRSVLGVGRIIAKDDTEQLDGKENAECIDDGPSQGFG
jgi:hypothetical protein